MEWVGEEGSYNYQLRLCDQLQNEDRNCYKYFSLFCCEYAVCVHVYVGMYISIHTFVFLPLYSLII